MEQNKTIKIIIAYHKQFFKIADDVYLPIQVNRKESEIKLDMQGDDNGDNISFKNSLYCEMTAVYWAWKNVCADYIGLFHYRRFFTLKKKNTHVKIAELKNYWKARLFSNSLHPGYNFSLTPLVYCNTRESFINNAKEFSNYLKNLDDGIFDAAFAKPYSWSNMTNEQYFMVIGRDYINQLKDICKQVSPMFYPSLIKSLAQNRLHAANMFVMRKDLFNEYCEIVFPLLDKVVDTMAKEGWACDMYKEKSTSRFVGYLAELLTNAYVCKLEDDGRKLRYFNVMMYEER